MKNKIFVIWYKLNIYHCTVAVKFYSWLKSFCDRPPTVSSILFKITGAYLIFAGSTVIVKQYSSPIPAGTMYILFGLLLMIVRRTK
ncbi:MAG TPA: hypothetical protein VHO94_04160 [Oscillospiraceae bacterium]|nr:hypothetical protein [Oscillospiraceae bacterium]